MPCPQDRETTAVKRRWRLMLKQVPNARNKSFIETLDYIVDNFAPKLRRQVANGGNASAATTPGSGDDKDTRSHGSDSL